MKTTQESIFSSKTLTYFLQLAETMNYTQASQILGITQPALTQQIKKLERTVGAPLFYSIGKKLRMTDAGLTMLNATHEIYSVLNKATDAIQQSTSATQGEISIGLLSSIEDRVLEDFIATYYKEHPDIRVTFYTLNRKEIWERLENNRIDLAIMYLPDESIKNWKPYASKKIRTEDLLFVHNNPELAGKEKVKLKDTLGAKWVTYPENYYIDQTIHETYKNHLIDVPTSVARFSTPNQIFRFADQTGTYTALPMSFLSSQKERVASKLEAVPFEPNIQFDLSFVYRKDKIDIPRITSFLDEFDAYLVEADYLTRLETISSEK